MAPETPRGVSSRLLTMKFMQRAAASASSAGSPDSEAHSAKKRKTDHSPSVARFESNFDQAAIKAAMDDQEAKRLAALAQHSTTDTHWVLNKPVTKAQEEKAGKVSRKIVYVGYGEIDSEDESGDNGDEPQQGRTSTRNYKQSSTKDKKPETSKSGSESQDESESGSDDDSDHSSPRRQQKRSRESSEAGAARNRSGSRSRSGHVSAQSAKAKEFRDKRKKKEVRLNKLTSISSAGDGQFGSGSSLGGKSMTCYRCQKPGHRAVDCPQRLPNRRKSTR